MRSNLIDKIFLSHFHGDHFGGLPFLFLEYIYVEPRQRPLQIIGPPGVQEAVMLLFRAMYADSAAQPLPYRVDFIEALPDEKISMDGLIVRAFQVPHQTTSVSLGYELWLQDKKIVYSGDTGWSEELPARSRQSDLFLCECTFFETRVPMHLDYPRIAEQKQRFESKRIILTHLGHEVLRRHHEVEEETASDGLLVRL